MDAIRTPASIRRVRAQRGFNIVELMVGIAISMLAVVMIMQVFSLFEAKKRSASGGADAQTSGALALYTIERDLRMAAFGAGTSSLVGCKINRIYDGNLLDPLVMTPAGIASGGANASDSIRILYSTKDWSVPARIVRAHPPTADNIFLNTTLGIAEGDMLVAWESGKDCTLFEATGINGNAEVHHSSGQSKWNPPGGHNIFPEDGYSTDALVFNLGNIVDRTYSIDANGNLQVSQYSSDSNSSTVQTLVPNVVRLKFQYGFDTRADPRTDARVDTWSDTVIDADGSKVAADPGDLQRIYAIRLAVVSRNAVAEKPKSDGTCDYYAGKNPQFKRPTWNAFNAETGKIEPVEIDLSKNPDGSDNKTWQCYRYKVFETVVPLRNRIWSQT